MENLQRCAECMEQNPSRARFCLSCGTPLGAATAPARRRLVTVVFCDLVGSSALADRRDHEAVRPLLERYHGAMKAAIERHGGVVEKFVGDAVVGVFGIEDAHEDDALRAARAALEMHAAVAELGTAGVGAHPPSVRIALASGEVVADRGTAVLGAVGGDVFNTAARLQASAAPGEVLVAEATAALLDADAELEPVDAIIAAGKRDPIAAARLLRVPGRRRVRRVAPLIGRSRHLALLDSAVDLAIAESACTLVTVLGEPGIGKSRLLQEFAVQASSRATTVTGRVPAYGEGATFAALVDVLKESVGMSDGPAVDVSRSLREKLSVEPDGGAVSERLADILGAGTSPTASETSWAVRRLFECLAADRPLIVVVDDVHWADEVLLDLLETVADRTRAPVVLCCLARTEFRHDRPGWGGGKARSLTFTLGSLGEADALDLASVLIQGAPSPATASRVVAVAEGNPLFLEQLAALIGEQAVTGAEALLPPTVQALLAARLDRIGADDAHLLSCAAVAGRRFRTETASALIDVPEAIVAARLEELDHRDLVHAVAGQPGTWEFAHGLVVEAAVRRLPKQTRADLHVRLADTTVAGNEDEETAGVHLERAVELLDEISATGVHRDELARRAGAYLAAAGDRAFARLDQTTALGLFERARKLLPEGSPELLRRFPDLAVALMESGRPADAASLLEAALTQDGSAVDALRCEAQLLATTIYLPHTEADLGRALARAYEIVAALEELADDVGVAQCLIVIEFLEYLSRGLDSHLGTCQRAISVATEARRFREQLQAAADFAAYSIVGATPAGRLRSLRERFRWESDPVLQSTGLTLEAGTAALAGDLAAVLVADDERRELLDRHGLEALEGGQALGLVQTLLDLGAAELAETTARRAIETFGRVGDVWWQSVFVALLPLTVAVQPDRFPDLLRLADQLEEEVSPIDDPHVRFMRALVQATALAAKRPDRAEIHARAAIAVASAEGFSYLRAFARERLADILAHNGRVAEACEELRDAARLFAAKESVPGVARVEAALGVLAGAG